MGLEELDAWKELRESGMPSPRIMVKGFLKLNQKLKRAWEVHFFGSGL
jgi:hypothetical protein